MSEDTSICGDRNMLAGIMMMAESNASPATGGEIRLKNLPPQQNTENMMVASNQQVTTAKNPNNAEAAYWTHSSIREIRA